MQESASTKKTVDTVILMSGSGSNARALLEYEKTHKECAYHVTGLVTDMPGSSNTGRIAEEYGLPWAHCDIRAFYMQHGEETTRLDTPRRRELRDQWSEKLYQTIREFPCEFLLFAGFMSLTNLAERIPCLNVHPGDLTRCDAEGRRLYTGLHVLPVEYAILNGEKNLRSSVILVQPYTGDGIKDADAGPIPGISGPVPVDPGPYTLDDLHAIKNARKAGVKVNDPLRQMALEHIERLKVNGDHIVFPPAASDFASGLFHCEGDKLFYRHQEVLTVEYTAGRKPNPVFKTGKDS